MPYPSKTNAETILATAMSQVAREGIDRLAIRSVAAELELTPNALYRYFPSLASLVGALASESRGRLLKVLKRSAGTKQPKESILSIARAYVRFAREQPNVFALTLMPPASERTENATHLQSWEFVLSQVARVYGEDRAPEAAVVLWAFLHGMTVLEDAGALGRRKPVSSFEFGLSMWIDAATLHS